jgi:hypothetical protein
MDMDPILLALMKARHSIMALLMPIRGFRRSLGTGTLSFDYPKPSSRIILSALN